MFPESFVQRQLLAYSQPGDQLFDPFCGRGTTILEGLLNDRQVIGSDINPVAACVSKAKAEIPTLKVVQARLDALAERSRSADPIAPPADEFFTACFHPVTLQHILFLQQSLKWRTDQIDCFIAAILLGVLHGESHKTELCLSNRMPRTISTKPDYSVRWWKAQGLTPPERNTFDVLKKMAEFRLGGKVPRRKGKVVLGDAREASNLLAEYEGAVSLIVTSPPYLDTTDYAEDQWLRLWFLGGPERPTPRLHKDDRHTQTSLYWTFLTEVWAGVLRLLRQDATIVIRIGGTRLSKIDLFTGLSCSLEAGLAGRTITALHDGETSTIKRRQTNSFRPGTSPEKLEHDFAFAVRA
ncbi:DNA methyltransferase [Mesorhizobium sp.]|uniref:DNA methyltransferase n=1 Tax=Mesorhizobium sp. TaxID=1871066 RepID=UPI0025CCF279|nr:DNA methyltransferase [Mesorhizobium sp.]